MKVNLILSIFHQVISKKESKELFKTWNNYSDLDKKIKTFHFYHSLMNFSIFLCLIREEKYKKSRKNQIKF